MTSLHATSDCPTSKLKSKMIPEQDMASYRVGGPAPWASNP